MKERWLQLNLREQRLVIAMISVVVVFILYSAVWSPLNSNIDKATTKIKRQHSLLAFVKEGTARYKSALGAANTNNRNSSLSSVVNQTAAQHQISISRMQPQGSDLQVWIDEVSFNQFIAWLDTLSTSQKVFVRSIDIKQGDNEGMVNVRRLQLGKN